MPNNKFILLVALFILNCSTPETTTSYVKNELEVINIPEQFLLDDAIIVHTNECPDDMILVEGDFCPELNQPCEKWANKKEVDDWNKSHQDEKQRVYTVCAQFKFPTQCLSKNTKHLKFCIDKLEYSSNENKIPDVMMNYHEMESICKNQNKRLCSDKEMTKACEGPENKPYPYGYTRDSTACNIDKPYIPWDEVKITHKNAEELVKVDQRVPTGSMKRCVSDYGVYDLVGNVDEISVNELGNHQPYDLALHGGHNIKSARNQCRATTLVHNTWFYLYNSGGRCCSNIKE